MRQTRLGAKWQSCSRPRLPVIDGKCSSLPSAVMARRLLREAQLEPDDRIRSFELALAQYIRGDRKAADAALADLIANARDSLDYQIAQVYAVRGEKDKAFEWLQIAFDDHDGGMPSLLVDPLLRGLRDDARYKNLVVKVGLPTTP